MLLLGFRARRPNLEAERLLSSRNFNYAPDPKLDGTCRHARNRPQILEPGYQLLSFRNLVLGERYERFQRFVLNTDFQYGVDFCGLQLSIALQNLCVGPSLVVNNTAITETLIFHCVRSHKTLARSDFLGIYNLSQILYWI